MPLALAQYVGTFLLPERLEKCLRIVVWSCKGYAPLQYVCYLRLRDLNVFVFACIPWLGLLGVFRTLQPLTLCVSVLCRYVAPGLRFRCRQQSSRPLNHPFMTTMVVTAMDSVAEMRSAVFQHPRHSFAVMPFPHGRAQLDLNQVPTLGSDRLLFILRKDPSPATGRYTRADVPTFSVAHTLCGPCASEAAAYEQARRQRLDEEAARRAAARNTPVTSDEDEDEDIVLGGY